MALRETNKFKAPKININWTSVRIILTIILFVSGMTVGLIFAVANPYWPSPDDISKIEVGMDKQEVFDILGETGWSEYDSSGFEYRWKFSTPSGASCIFSVTTKNDIVTHIYTY